MSAPTLFRKEVLDARASRLHGDINLAVPVSWQAIGFLLSAGLGVSVVFLGTSTYARVETVSGTIEPASGVAAVVPTRAGVITEIMTRDGASVNIGDPLLRIRVEDALQSGEVLGEQLVSALADQDARMEEQASSVQQSGIADLSVQEAQISGYRDEIDSLQRQISEQNTLISSAKGDVDAAQLVADKGFISKKDMRARIDTLSSRRQQLAQLQQSLSNKRSSLIEAVRGVSAIKARTKTQIAEIESGRIDISQRLANAQAARGYTLKSPVSGLVTSLTAKLGSPVNSGRPLMMVVPSSTIYQAELRVPSHAIGQIRVGQNTRIAIDAFPYQTFGTVEGKVLDIASATLPSIQTDGTTKDMYRVVVSIAARSIPAFGENRPLVSGMTVTGRIVLRRQSLIQWLFEPLYAVGKR